MHYKYAEGDLLESPNTYFYSEYGGSPFLAAWMGSRRGVERALPPPARSAPAGAGAGAGQEQDAVPVLERAAATAASITPKAPLPADLEGLLKRFEISKRVFEAYDSQYRPVDRSAYRRLGHYVRLAEVFEVAYANGGDLRVLNALLKILDTLCAHHVDLDPALGARLARLIARERKHVQKLGGDMGVPLS